MQEVRIRAGVAVGRIAKIVTIRAIHALVAELARFDKGIIKAASALINVVAVHAIFVLVSACHQVAILTVARAINVIAVLVIIGGER